MDELDPRCLDARREVGDLLRRFERPRFYAGDYEADFAERIVSALLETGWQPPG